MIIDFEIKETPKHSEEYRRVTDIEGVLRIKSTNLQESRLDGILLVELAIELTKWLKEPENIFYYVSMDFEEEPILAFYPTESTAGRVESVWINMPIQVELDDFRRATVDYVRKLKSVLLTDYNISIDDIL